MTAPLIHPSAIVDAGATLGEGSRVWHFSHVCAGAVVGAGCSLGQNVFVANRVVIGDNVSFEVSEDLLRSHGVEVVVLNDAETTRMFEAWMTANPRLWNEDIGED